MSAASEAPKPRRVSVYRHPIVVRATHWVNAVCLACLLASGLQIFNAHPALYWGNKSSFAAPIISVSASPATDDHPSGRLNLFGWKIDTTGFLGVSRGADGAAAQRAFPRWMTLPADTDLATGRRWHFSFAWLFVANLIGLLGFGLISGRFRRMLGVSAREWREIPHALLEHLRLQFPKGEAALHYNVLQKLAYIAVIGGLLPLMVLTGLSMSPGFDAAAGWLPALFGGRQSARTVHFISASGLVLFFFIHIVMVLASGVFNNLRSITTGRFSVDLPAEDVSQDA